jgi:ElaB/YqjD/DUF883 family membrane-anchored ribosome-binding protein
MMNEVKNQAALAAANIESKVSSAEQSQLISEAIEQMKTATDAICKAFGAVGSTSSDLARLKFNEGKAKAKEIGHKVESSISEKPLTSVGIAFAAGWLVSRLMKS